MRVLHTSDWHLGASLFGRRRIDEHSSFLDWLANLIDSEGIGALLVCGDVFDTCTPSNASQELYYRFLCRVAASSTCRHVVVIGGNHDSPSFLDAPSELLKCLSVHVRGTAAFSVDPRDSSQGCDVQGDIEAEVLVLKDTDDAPEAIVCAVPHLRDRDVRTAGAGQTPEEKDRLLAEGIERHYSIVGDLATGAIAGNEGIPVIVTGHLFAAGGRTVEGDGVRDLYVGTLGRVPVSVFPKNAAYVALGHLHVPQTVAGIETIRYSGSPIPMGFGEAGQVKSVCIVDFIDSVGSHRRPEAEVRTMPIPCFQRLEQIKGPWNVIESRLKEIAAPSDRTENPPWVEIIYDGDEIASDLRERISGCLEGSGIEVLRIKNDRVTRRALAQGCDSDTLEDLEPSQVFERCLEAHSVPETQRPHLRMAFQEILLSLTEDGSPEDKGVAERGDAERGNAERGNAERGDAELGDDEDPTMPRRGAPQ